MIRLTVCLAAVLALSACGKQGDLSRPEPVWGNLPQSAPGSNEENIDPTSNNRNMRERPPGGVNDPFGPPPRGLTN